MIRHNGKIILGVDLGNYNIKTEDYLTLSLSLPNSP
jgi:hypothetical protein